MIGLIQLDGKSKNIALEKIKLFYELKDEEVRYITPIESDFYDKVFCSSIFTFTDKSYVKDNWICGGSGFNLTTKLPDEIDKMKPKINIGFTTRGCIRQCPFCIVPQKEGKIRVVGDIYDFWDSKSKNITLFDNNILALPKHFKLICSQLKKEKLRVDFNQGLDIRLVDDEIAKELSLLRYSRQLRFSFDDIKMENIVKEKMKILKKYIIPSRIMFFILCGFNSTFEEDMARWKLLHSYGVDVYVMRYHKKLRLLNEFAHWSTLYNLKGLPFEKFLEIRKVDKSLWKPNCHQ